MLNFNIENIQELVERAYIHHAHSAFGAEGATAIRALLNCVKLIYQRCPPEKIQGTLAVVVGVQASPVSPATAPLGTLVKVLDYATVGKALVANPPGSHAVVERVSDGTFRVLSLAADIDLKGLAQSALVYRFDGHAERFLAKDFEDFVPPISPLLKSNFATPTLNSLEEAFHYYGDYVLETNCRILKEVWEGGVDGPRLVLVNKPEARMRDSLAQALEFLLRDVTVKPEQNTDETKPVDIRVSWFASGATALIEVKWLGKSTAKSQSSNGVPTYTEYGSPRAQAGANQLADYLDREVRHSGAIAPTGYLVVFDARRKGTEGPADLLTESDAMAFANDVLTFNPDHSTRSDFEPPVRFFMKPRTSYFKAA
ncbi:hypothetical protein [Mesorhizobium sp. BR1-1-15]|uniref:hypothetical protein n=1 Tax=Mesorhizobium sp. BR1-1-15 TaxID=2876654 RepID=UPI001CC92E34|nr:hypothetical protein [Mesorhizobium sp. BR1-1-15]MBZ9953955.1 hypothetical protein [Mesorhizobium sp. BR1-1-15]